MENNKIDIYIASSCKNNGKQDAKGAIGVCTDENIDDILVEIIQDSSITNQKLDLMAIKLALEKYKDYKTINIYSRSEYAVKCTTEWGLKWKNDNWLNVSKKSIKNLELIKDVIVAIETIETINTSVNVIYVPKNKITSQLLALYHKLSLAL